MADKAQDNENKNTTEKPKELKISVPTFIHQGKSHIVTGRINELGFIAWFSDRPSRKGIDNGKMYRLIIFDPNLPEEEYVLVRYDGVWVKEAKDDMARMVYTIIRYCDDYLVSKTQK